MRLPIRKNRRSQGAMEYLMTYGWAILIIAIVMVAIFQLHLFDPYTFSPKASTGSCQVIRPNGPGSNIFVSEIGEDCQTNEIPQYVAQFNGQNSEINLGNSSYLSPEAGSNGEISICLWYSVISFTNYHGLLFKAEPAPDSGNGYEYGLNGQPVGQEYGQGYVIWMKPGGNIAANSIDSAQINTWKFTCFTYSYPASEAYFYVDNNQYPTTFTTGTPASVTTSDLMLGTGVGVGGVGGYSNVELSNLQIYNISLTEQQVQALYSEGIGGAPLDISNLAGWWPLNGNANDYSGNNDNGNSIAVNFVSNWENGYTTP